MFADSSDSEDSDADDDSEAESPVRNASPDREENAGDVDEDPFDRDSPQSPAMDNPVSSHPVEIDDRDSDSDFSDIVSDMSTVDR